MALKDTLKRAVQGPQQAEEKKEDQPQSRELKAETKEQQKPAEKPANEEKKEEQAQKEKTQGKPVSVDENAKSDEGKSDKVGKENDSRPRRNQRVIIMLADSEVQALRRFHGSTS